MIISIIPILVWITALLIGSIAITIYLSSNKLSSRIFVASIIIVTLWITFVGFLMAVQDEVAANFLAKLTYFLGSTIAASFLPFFISFPEEKIPKKYLVYGLLALQGIFLYLFLFTDLIVNQTYLLKSAHGWGWHYGPISFLFELFFFGFFISGITIFFRKLRKEKDQKLRSHLKLMLCVIIVGSIPPSLVSIILPRFGYFDLNWLGPISEVFWIPIIGYSIVRHHLFNAKIITIELVTFGLWIVILIRTFLAQNLHEVIVECFLLLVTISFGILLIRSVLHEIEQREKIETLATDLKKAYGHLRDLNDHLEQKVADQTKEIRAAYEVEKKARRELERLNQVKDQFITSTQHHLRTPLTALKWELESIKASAGNTVGPELEEALKNADESIGDLSHIIENFISITGEKEKETVQA